MAEQKKVAAQIVITMFEDSSINVHGAIEDKIFFHGLLECAKEAVNDHHKRLARDRQDNRIVVPDLGFRPAPTGGNGK